MNRPRPVTLVAGASRPVGRAIAARFGAGGSALVLPCHDDWPESTEEMKGEFAGAGFDFLLQPCDLTEQPQVDDLLRAAEDRYGRLDYLINNIERGGMPIVHGSYDRAVNRGQWELELATTLAAKRNLYTRAAPLLQRSGSGAIVNITSIAGAVGRAGPAAPLFSDGYSAANRGVASLTIQWAREMAPQIRVNEVMLGLVRGRHGEGTRGWSLLSAEQREALSGHTLAGRTGSPAEVAELVWFVAVKATYMTGSTVVCDGGYLIGGEPVPPLEPGVLG